MFSTSEQTRIDKLEQIPQFGQVVLNGCTGKNDLSSGFQLHGCLRHLCVGILYSMCFVETNYVPFASSEYFQFYVQQCIGSNNNVASLCFFYIGYAIATLVEYDYVERGRKAFQLVAPIWYYRCRSNHKRWAFTALFQQQSYGLQRLSQSHIIGKTHTCTPRCNLRQPFETFLLVVAQLGVKCLRDKWYGLATFFNPAAQFVNGRVALKVQRFIIEKFAQQRHCRRSHLQARMTFRCYSVDPFQYASKLSAQCNVFVVANANELLPLVLSHYAK